MIFRPTACYVTLLGNSRMLTDQRICSNLAKYGKRDLFACRKNWPWADAPQLVKKLFGVGSVPIRIRTLPLECGDTPPQRGCRAGDPG
jgi:hypothetical protein